MVNVSRIDDIFDLKKKIDCLVFLLQPIIYAKVQYEVGGIPSVGIFLKESNLYLHTIRRKTRKIQNFYDQITRNVFEPSTFHQLAVVAELLSFWWIFREWVFTNIFHQANIYLLLLYFQWNCFTFLTENKLY